jgi:hypothetical protein
MTTYAGIDLHSSNCYLAVIDQQQTRLFGKRLPNSLEQVQAALQPFKEGLSGAVVESTFNWYWRSTGCRKKAIGSIWPIHRPFASTKGLNTPTTNGTLSGWRNFYCSGSCPRATSTPGPNAPPATCCGAGCCLCVSAPRIFSACRAWCTDVPASAFRPTRSSSSHPPTPRCYFPTASWSLMGDPIFPPT